MTSATQFATKASDALMKSSHRALRKLSVEEAESALVISGQVTSYYLKQLAQETIMPVRGPLTLVNKVNVESDFAR